MKIHSFLIIGGDARLSALAVSLRQSGFAVHTFSGEQPLKNAVEKCDSVILGLPASRDDKYVNAPQLKTPVLLKDLFQLMGSGKRLFAGKMTDSVKAVADVFGILWADYCAREEFEILNAVPSTEGAIQLAMEETAYTLNGANVLITGYGKIGRILSRSLSALGANVTVCARRAQSRAQIRADNLTPSAFAFLPQLCKNTDILFNTVPQRVIEKEALVNLKNALVIDLASNPGGVDFEAARDIGVRVIWALGLPGKVAPVTAGEIIKDTIFNILSETGDI